MQRTFDLLTAPLGDNERSVVSANIAWPNATNFRVSVAPAVATYFATSTGLFDGKRFSISVRRIGISPKRVRFSALVECTTAGPPSPGAALANCYWPPPDSTLFEEPSERRVEPSEMKPRAALPIFLTPRTSIELSGFRVFINDQGIPLAAIADVPVPSDDHRRGLCVPFEYPLPIELPANKPGREWIQFANARADLRRSKSDVFEGRVRFGSDPPDLVLENATRYAVELAQFTHGERRLALALMQGVRGALRMHDPSRFAHLAGHLVMIGFDTPRGLPPRTVDHGDIASVVSKLEHLTMQSGEASAGNMRDGFVVSLVNSPLGERNIAAFPVVPVPDTELGRSHGFDLAASYTTTTTARDTEQELARIVAAHDREGNDILLLSAGSPAASGLCLLADEIAVEPQLLECMTFPAPRHLKRIILHRWAFGDVYELSPTLRCLAMPTVSLSEGGVIVVTARGVVADAWSESCPCGSGQPFASCHGCATVPCEQSKA